MINQLNSSVLLEEAVEEFSRLPGIGRKTALRLVLYLLKQPADQVNRFGQSLIRLKNEIKYCHICHNLSDEELCPICQDSRRNRRQICVVEHVRDVMAIEHTGQYGGVYHVLGGLISPMEGISPSSLEIESLVRRLQAEGADDDSSGTAGYHGRGILRLSLFTRKCLLFRFK
jgi:recombination protein RecR